MTEKSTLQWIKANLSPIIDKAISDTNSEFKTDLLAAMTMRETGILIMKYSDKPFKEVCELMKGDYGQRSGDKVKMYHGFGYVQIDIDSFPDFIKSGDWKDPYKTYVKAIEVLNEKGDYLLKKLGSAEIKAVVASYNCGAGNVYKAIKNGKDVDYYTFNKDYSREVFRYRDIYNSLPT